MKIPELDEAIMKAVLDSDHPEVVRVERVPTSDKPQNHTRVKVEFANGATAHVMVGEVRSGSKRGAPYEVPREVLS